MTEIQSRASSLLRGTSYPCDAKSCVALRSSTYPLPCAERHREQGDEGNGINCVRAQGCGGNV